MLVMYGGILDPSWVWPDVLALKVDDEE